MSRNVERETRYLPLDELQPAARNPKGHDLARVRASIDRFGFVSPAVRDERTGRLVVGHGRVEVLKQMRDDGESPPEGVRVDEDGRWLVPVLCGWASRSDAEAEAYLVVDNHFPALGGWDYPMLDQVLTSIDAVDAELGELVAFDRDMLADLIKANEPPDLDQLADEVGEPEPWDTWPVLRLRVPPHLAAAWQEHLNEHGDDEVEAFAALLGISADPPGEEPA